MATQQKVVKAVGKSMEEAVKNACEELGVTEEQIDVELIQDATTGIMGMITGKKMKIRAVIKPEFHTETPVGFTYYSSDDLVRIEDEAKDEAASKQADYTNPRQILDNLCKMIQPGARVERFNRKDHILLRIISDGTGIFIGNKGSTLDSLQYIVNKMVHKATGDETIKIVVDSENYRTRRMNHIESMASRMITQVRRSGKAISTEPLNAFNRRIVHLSVRRAGGLSTESLGTGEMKRVQISPGGGAPNGGGSRDKRPRREDSRQRPPRQRSGGRPGKQRNDSSQNNRKKGSGRKPVFLEDQPQKPKFEIRGEEGFDSDKVSYDDDPMPEMFVNRPKNKDEDGE